MRTLGFSVSLGRRPYTGGLTVLRTQFVKYVTAYGKSYHIEK